MTGRFESLPDKFRMVGKSRNYAIVGVIRDLSGPITPTMPIVVARNRWMPIDPLQE